MKLKQMTKALMAIGVVHTLVAIAPAFAQEAEPKVQKIEITGSSIKRTSVETSASVQIMTREDIERTGATTALGILTDSVAVGTSLNAASSSSGSFATGASAAGMRGLGKVATLVLVNGRRIAPYGLADGAQDNFTNLNAIAADAIERIEILKDGASAIYGSDAIAGVINIILRKNFQGGQVKAGYSTAENFSDLRNRNVSAIYGFGDVNKDGFNTYLNIEGVKRDGYTTGDLRNQYPEWHRQTPGRSTWDAKSSFSPTGNYFLSSTNIVAAPGCPAGDIDPVDKQCKMDILPYSGITTNSERYALASSTHFKIGKEIDANFELTYSNSYDSYILTPFNVSNGSTTTSSSIWYNVYGGKMVGPFTYPKLPVGHPNNPYTTPVEYRARMMDTGNGFNFNKTNTDQYRAMLALEGTVGAYDWKSAFGHMESSADKATRAVSAKGYTDAIINKTYVFGKQNDRALLETMFPIRTTKGKSTISFLDGTLTGELMQLPAGPLSFALGADVRREAYEMKSSDNVLNGELVGIFGLQVKDTRNQYAIFSEATIPVVKNFEVSAALRADKQGDFDAHVSPKLGLRYTATDSLLLRATASGGFRAPNIVESGNGLGRSSVATGVNDLRRCPIATELNNLIQNSKTATTADKALGNSYRSNDCSAGLPSFVASNPNLAPETSRSYTMGLVFAPTKQWSFAIDYFNIERQDEIGTRSVTDILKGEASLPAGQLLRVDNTATDNEFLALVKKYAPTNAVGFQNIGKLGLVYNPYVNTGKTRASGFDFDLTSRIKLDGLGTLRLQLEGNYELNYQTYSVADGKWNKNLSGTYDRGGQMEAKVVAALKTGKWDNAVIVNYFSGYSANSLASPTYCVTQKVAPENMATCERIDAGTFVNYSLTYSGFKNTKLNLYVGNVFQTENPTDWRGGWSPSFRTVYVNATYKF
ncbi:TonB-dependent receptor plug domain-containing protein [Undibacterium sp. Ji22W]|uniref:TonB-dependent receptor plug domain-containing protein n=1 Tax=Undibacterium sp. Ji22W TaxID=3413038 RepID=UPI003BF18C22